MQPSAEPQRPFTRLAIATGTLFVLLAVVAVASRSGLGGGAASSPRADRVLLDRLFTGFLVLLLIYLPIAAWVYWSERHYLKSELVRRRRAGRRRNLLVLTLFAAALLVRFRTHLGHLRRLPGMQTAPAPGGARAGGRTVPYEPHVDWGVALALGLVVVAVLAVLAVLGRRRRAKGSAEPADARERLALALTESLHDLLAERDPRRAVIAAYARMERALGEAGVPRVQHEVPFEYVGRALLVLEVDESSARRLTALFERARFSTHEIDESMRADAIAALTAIRDELAHEAAA